MLFKLTQNALKFPIPVCQLSTRRSRPEDPDLRCGTLPYSDGFHCQIDVRTRLKEISVICPDIPEKFMQCHDPATLLEFISRFQSRLIPREGSVAAHIATGLVGDDDNQATHIGRVVDFVCVGVRLGSAARPFRRHRLLIAVRRRSDRLVQAGEKAKKGVPSYRCLSLKSRAVVLWAGRCCKRFMRFPGVYPRVLVTLVTFSSLTRRLCRTARRCIKKLPSASKTGILM
jgi:hypothetical protein